MKIYTKTGDSGQTGLLRGDRVWKDNARVEACGSVDELNALIGVVRAEGVGVDDDQVLAAVQEHLFQIGAALATPDRTAPQTPAGALVEWLERAIDQRQTLLAPLRAFILPGGSRPAASLHLARCVCRRAERRSVPLARDDLVSMDLVKYLNRLSDLLFVLARVANHRDGVPDTLWTSSAPPSSTEIKLDIDGRSG